MDLLDEAGGVSGRDYGNLWDSNGNFVSDFGAVYREERILDGKAVEWTLTKENGRWVSMKNMIFDISNKLFDICKITAILRFAYFLVVERGGVKRNNCNIWKSRNSRLNADKKK